MLELCVGLASMMVVVVVAILLLGQDGWNLWKASDPLCGGGRALSGVVLLRVDL